MRNFPFDFLLKTMLDTQSVGSSTFSITPRSTIWLISFFTSSLMWIGHRLGACTTGVTVGSNVMWRVSRNFPIPSKQSGYIRGKSSLDFSGGWSSLTSQFNVTNFSLRHVGSPKITGPGVSATKNSVSYVVVSCAHFSRVVPYCQISCPL